MAKVYVECYAEMATVYAGDRLVQAPKEPSVAMLTPVAIGGGSVVSAVFPKGTRFIRVHTDAICSVKIAADPTATADDKRLAANATEFFGVEAGHKIAVITNT